MFVARAPFGLCSTSYWTLSFSFSVLNPDAWMAEKCTKRSLLPSSGVMKPKPLASLNHFTLPVLMSVSLRSVEKGASPADHQGGNERTEENGACVLLEILRLPLYRLFLRCGVNI